jgi:cyanophycin synthetase
MKFLDVFALRGPNVWSRRPCLEVWVELGELAEAVSNTIPGFYERLSTWLPSLIEHRCGLGYRGGFLERLRDGTYPGHVLEHVTLELQGLAGSPQGFGKARETSTPGTYKVVIRYGDEELGLACLHAARELVLAAMRDEPFDLPGRLASLKALAERVMLGPSTAAIVEAANQRGIPVRRLTEGNLVVLGQGHRQRRIWTAETDRTGAIAESIAQDKALTRDLLRDCGVPVPDGRLVQDAADAWKAAQELGGTLVVKPRDANHRRGVSLGLETREQVEAAFPLADAQGNGVLLERQVEGVEHRLLVVDGKLVAAVRGDKEEALDVTAQVHPEVAACAVLAVQVVGLDVAGVDLVARDIARPLQEQGGAVLEVNSGPGLRMHVQPTEGSPQPVGQAILEGMFPGGDDGRIPVVCVTGTDGRTVVTRLVAHLLREAGKRVGLACADGVFVERRGLQGRGRADAEGARRVLLNPVVEAAVLEADSPGILREGLGFDRCEVAVVTGIGESERMEQHYLHSAKDMFTVYRCGVDVVLPTGCAVLNAADPLVAEMAPLCAGSVTFFARNASHPVVTAHLGDGKRAVLERDGRVVLACGTEEQALLETAEVPVIRQGREGCRVEDVLAAAAAAWALGLAPGVIRAGLATY